MSAGLDALKHIVVLMMENRSFDHMLGCLQADDNRINGLTGNEQNPDTQNEPVKVQPSAQFQGQLDPDPNHHFPEVHRQLFAGNYTPGAVPTMSGFVQSYYTMQQNVNHSHKIMYYFTPGQAAGADDSGAQLRPVQRLVLRPFPARRSATARSLITARRSARSSMDMFIQSSRYLSIYERLLNAGNTTKLYYFDTAVRPWRSSTC